MIKTIVSRDDTLSQSMPDLALAANGTLVCVFRESALYPQQGAFETPAGRLKSRISVRISRDEGGTWGPLIPVGGVRMGEGFLNCPRLCRSQDGTLLLAVDWIPPSDLGERNPSCHIWLWRSRDHGQTWEGPQETPVCGLVPSLRRLRDGTLLCGSSGWNEGGEEVMWAHRSPDGGRTWEGPMVVAEQGGHSFSEGDFVELEDGVIVCYLREERHPPVSLKAISGDGGRTWQGPFRAGLLSCLGRPSAGLLRSGEVVVTHRCDFSGMFCMYVESQSQAADRTPPSVRVFGRSFMIDVDRAPVSHWGYSGWVQLSGGDLYVVQHIIDDAAPGARHIRGYRVARSDWALYPEPVRGEGVFLEEVEPYTKRLPAPEA